MNIEEAERRFRELQRQRDRGDLDEATFRVEVAKLLLRDQQGTFWMLDADSGTWFCNRGEGWTAGDPHGEPGVEAGPAQGQGRRRVWLAVAGAVLLATLGVVTGWGFWRRGGPWPGPSSPAPTADTGIRVTISSPADGSQVVPGQVVAIEATIVSITDLRPVARVEFSVNGEMVAVQAVRAQIQPAQSSLPLSQPWRPPAVGLYRVVVTALSGESSPLGAAAITLHAVERPAGAQPGPACTPDAAFLADVTIAPGSAFPPGARMDKVWQVYNSGSCAWGMGYELVLVDGDPLGAPGAIPVPSTLAGERADLAVTLWAPDTPGRYANAWQLQAPDGRFFGPRLTLTVSVEVQAVENRPPTSPANLRAALSEGGQAVLLTWEDRSDNEEAFRIYRTDVEASIGLAPANARQFVDRRVTCGHTYRYMVIAFNATGPSPASEVAQVTLPPCPPADAPPTLLLTVVPARLVAGQILTIAFQAGDDLALGPVIAWGGKTGEPELDPGMFDSTSPPLPIGVKLSDSSRTSGACGQASTGVDAAVRAGGRPGAGRRSAPTGAISNRPRLTLMPMGQSGALPLPVRFPIARASS